MSLATSCVAYVILEHVLSGVVPTWNSLSNHVVSGDTVNTFKHRLDKFWLNQEVIYNYKADLVGTGSRSNIILVLTYK